MTPFNRTQIGLLTLLTSVVLGGGALVTAQVEWQAARLYRDKLFVVGEVFAK